MSNTIRVKRRAGGAAGAPASLENAELAFNEVDNSLWIGKGTGGAGGSATVVIPIGGDGAFVALTGDQTIGGNKAFSQPVTIATGTQPGHAVTKAQMEAAIGGAGGGDMMAGTYDPRGIEADAFDADNHTDGAANKVFTAAEKTKLGNVAANATANDSDANLKSRANHTGSQAINTVEGLADELAAKLPATQKGVANGVASLGADGKVPTGQLPDSVLGGMAYQGTWNASTNTPAIPAAAAGNNGHYYVVTTAGSTNVDGITDWQVGDWIASNGATWDKVDNTDAVVTVNGKTGAVVLDVDDLASAGSMAEQDADAVAITGGTIDGVVIDGGTF